MTGYIFVDDGYPEADEYDSNYLAYDPADSESVRSALRRAQASSAPSRQDANRSGAFGTPGGLRWIRTVMGIQRKSACRG